MKDKAYFYYIYCKVKDRIQKEKQVIQLDQDVHVYGLWRMEWKLLLYDLSPYINSFESMAIFFFFFFFSWKMCPHFFLFFNTWTFMCPFFLIDHVSFFNKTWRER